MLYLVVCRLETLLLILAVCLKHTYVHLKKLDLEILILHKYNQECAIKGLYDSLRSMK